MSFDIQDVVGSIWFFVKLSKLVKITKQKEMLLKAVTLEM